MLTGLTAKISPSNKQMPHGGSSHLIQREASPWLKHAYNSDKWLGKKIPVVKGGKLSKQAETAPHTKNQGPWQQPILHIVWLVLIINQHTSLLPQQQLS